MEFNQFPKIYQILQKENLLPDGVLSNGNLLCRDNDGNKFVMKDLVGLEGVVYTDIFPSVNDQKIEFKILILPKLYKIVDKFIFFEFYNGKSFNETWDEFKPNSLGGRGVPLNSVNMFIDLIFDFSKIDISRLPTNLIEFDLDLWKSVHFKEMSKGLEKFGLLSKEQILQANNILQSDNLFNKSKKILTNGDFYPRNFILMPDNKIVVIDWEGRTDINFEQNIPGYRNAMVNFIENHVAFLYVHMWGNPLFQQALLKKSIATFNLDAENVRASILIKSLEQAFLWIHNYDGASYLSMDQVQIFVNMFNLSYFESIIS